MPRAAVSSEQSRRTLQRSSDTYDMWSDCLSDVYDEWSDALSDIYDFWSDVHGEMWDGDTVKAKKEITEFEEDIKALREKE